MTLATQIPPTAPTTLYQQLQHRSLAELIADVQARVRVEPTEAAHRWLLCQLLCLTGDWSRARKQLPVIAALAPERAAFAMATVALIDAEEVRGCVLAGRRAPDFVGEPPEWARGLVKALAQEAAGDQVSADACREKALGEAQSPAGSSSLGRFAWLADADSRLGPVCEVIVDGQYRWLPFSALSAIVLSPPADVLDLIWAPATLVLQDGAPCRGYLPARYPGSEEGSDTIRLGGMTTWREQGSTGVFGLGQKMWMSDAGEWAVRDVRECRFDPPGAGHGEGDAR